MIVVVIIVCCYLFKLFPFEVDVHFLFLYCSELPGKEEVEGTREVGREGGEGGEKEQSIMLLWNTRVLTLFHFPTLCH